MSKQADIRVPFNEWPVGAALGPQPGSCSPDGQKLCFPQRSEAAAIIALATREVTSIRRTNVAVVRQVPKGHFMVTPNPGLLARTFSFGLGAGGWVTIEIYDAAGRLVATPFSGELDPGPQAIRWDGRGARGANLSHGQYFARVTTPVSQQTIKLLILSQ